MNDSVGYVGMAECKTCHYDKHETFIHTGMGQSFSWATKVKSKGNFKNVSPIYDAKRNLYYLPKWKNEDLYICEYRLENGDTIHYREEKIVYIIGSGQHTNSHFWKDGDFLYQAPLTFYTQQGKWDLPPGFDLNNSSFERKIDVECMSCHNAIPKVDESSFNRFNSIPLGIDCERCHGPGELHVKQKKQGILVDTSKEADRSIVNPKRLPFQLQVDICQRCHLQGNNVLKPGKKFTDFRPGMKLSDVFEIYMPKYENNDKFVMAGHAERFQKSQCFIHSNPNKTEVYNPKLNFTCINCHNPHVSVKSTGSDKFNLSCVNCHTENSTKSKLQNCKLDKGKQIHANGCVGCHMPASGSEDIPHVTVHDHKIQRPSKNKQKEKGALLGLYSINNAKTDKHTEIQAYLSYFEKFENNPLYLRKADELIEQSEKTDIEQQIYYAYLKKDFKGVVSKSQVLEESSINDAWTCYRIAKSLDATENLSASIGWYKRAYILKSNNLDYGVEYANALIRLKQITEAKELLIKQLNIAKKHQLTLLNLGVAYYLEQNMGLAKRYFQQVLDLNPDHKLANLYMSELYNKVGDVEKSKIYLKKSQ